MGIKLNGAEKSPLVLVICALPFQSSFSQDVDARSPKAKKKRKTAESSQQVKADKRRKAEKRRLLGIEKESSGTKKLQAKGLQKMMKASKRKSKRWNEEIKREFFFKTLVYKKTSLIYALTNNV
ncbi:MAG: hypothetical protein IPN61_09195 [Bacteroidetes bacterium]|nr:hypothetical protein [Bacteroidota bacterium]